MEKNNEQLREMSGHVMTNNYGNVGTNSNGSTNLIISETNNAMGLLLSLLTTHCHFYCFIVSLFHCFSTFFFFSFNDYGVTIKTTLIKQNNAKGLANYKPGTTFVPLQSFGNDQILHFASSVNCCLFFCFSFLANLHFCFCVCVSNEIT
ncbi:hypothetical protein RFI_08320 [Reticulomyxa filosa]|uniref:Uncharacterized protein n=1 Tax=Reticulomyxa filosa TaxID=46433 RepID=X6NS96_RETFI|nr:hypothetical protein RFI_08320 [Reticulomyxa filosa]|eukprot:ETO28808.1 hypothetical protein RFI_08320 [Reticulomyxa filosa]